MTRRIFFLIAFGLAMPVRADVSDSGDLTIGGNGVIQGTMTIQGSAFSVGDTTFTVAGGSVTLGGRLNAAAAGIKWADGTTSTTAASSGGGAAISSATVVTEDKSTTSGAMGPCVSGSTVTLTCTGFGNIEIYFYGTIDNADGTAGYGAAMNVLLNGQYLPGFSPTKWAGRVINDNYNALPMQVGIPHREASPCTASTVYSACVTLARINGGTAYLRGSLTPFRIQIMEKP